MRAMMLPSICRQVAHDKRGVTALEFAIIAPVFLTMLMGTFNLGQAVYLQGVFHGAVQEAGRDAGLESGSANLSAIDNLVMQRISGIAPQGSIISSRRNYASFSDVSTPEDFEDANNNSAYDDNECFTDINGNGSWDADRAASGLGGADDVVVYSAELTYEWLIPMDGFLDWGRTNTVSASTVLRNQPFGNQAERPENRICPA